MLQVLNKIFMDPLCEDDKEDYLEENYNRPVYPVRIWPYLYGNRPAVWMYGCILQNMDNELSERSEIATWMIASLLSARSIVEYRGSYRLLTFAYFKSFPGLKSMAGPGW